MQHGTHTTDLVVQNGQLHCTVCDKDVCALAPEWLEHNTDVEGEAAPAAAEDTAPVDPEPVQPS